MRGWLGVAPRGPGRAWLTRALDTVTFPLRRGHNSQENSCPALSRSGASGHPKALDPYHTHQALHGTALLPTLRQANNLLGLGVLMRCIGS